MNMLISHDRSDAQKHNLLYFISGNQLFKLTVHDMRNSLVKEVLEKSWIKDNVIQESFSHPWLRTWMDELEPMHWEILLAC